MGKKNKAKKQAPVQPEPVAEEQRVAGSEPEEPEPDETASADDADCANSEATGHGQRVTFTDFCKRMARYGLAVPELGNRSTAAEAKRWARVFVEALAMTVAHGETVHVPDLGTFSVVDRKERNGTDPRTGEKIVISARRSVHFSPAKAFKEAING